MARAQKTWFITGASRGLGFSFAREALEAGDRVVATARKVESLASLAAHGAERLLALPLDVLDRGEIEASAKAALDAFGHIDVLVNNAGYGLDGALEENSEAEVRHQMEVNFFGVIWLMQAILPSMRARKSGHIVQISSVAGVGGFPSLGMYCASKWALEGLSEGMAGELAPFGVKMTIIQPGAFRTDWAGDDSMIRSARMDAYEFLTPQRERMRTMSGQAGDPDRAAKALLEICDMAEPPLRVVFGRDANANAIGITEARLANWKTWQAFGAATDFPETAPKPAMA
jgi:NAD(P)-dependent dehydrogenase (short-subunit alcohol dehydrogenase family)